MIKKYRFWAVSRVNTSGETARHHPSNVRYEPDVHNDDDDVDDVGNDDNGLSPNLCTSPLLDYSETTIAVVEMIYFGAVNIHLQILQISSKLFEFGGLDDDDGNN